MPDETIDARKHPLTLADQRNRVTMALVGQDIANTWLLEEAQVRGWRWELVRDGGASEVATRGALLKCLPDDPVVAILKKNGCAVVRLGRLPHPQDHLLPAVLPDLTAQGRMAADHFADREFRDVAYFGHAPWGDAEALFEGFRDQAHLRKMACHLHTFERVPREPFEVTLPRQNLAFTTWIKTLPKPVGILAPGDFIASSFAYLTRSAGFAVPEDIAILGRGNKTEICECASPSISSIDINDAHRMHMACDVLEALVAGGKVSHEPVMVPPSCIIERESTSVMATPDKQVALALRFMWDHLDLDISVDDIAEAASLSSRQLKRRFRASLGRGINEELRRKRLEELKRLLRSTSYSIAELAPLVGFKSTTYLHRTFRDAFGMTPAQYRNNDE